MRRFIAVVLTSAATIAGAQAPGAPPAPQGVPGGARTAQSFLARSAELDLTDQQVTRLAAIARRAEARQRTLRAQMDSGRARFTQPGDSVARRQFADRMRTTLDKEREQARSDLRDALSVLTPDQQARAWEWNARRERVGRIMDGARGARGGMRRPGGGRGGMGGPGQGGGAGRRPMGDGPDGMGGPARGMAPRRFPPDMPVQRRRPLDEPPAA